VKNANYEVSHFVISSVLLVLPLYVSFSAVSNSVVCAQKTGRNSAGSAFYVILRCCKSK